MKAINDGLMILNKRSLWIFYEIDRYTLFAKDKEILQMIN